MSKSAIKLRFYCKDHGYVPAGFGEKIQEVYFNQHGELGLSCPLCFKSRPMKLERSMMFNDRTGQEMYEGDIVADDAGSFAVVMWDPGDLCFILNDMEEYTRGNYDEPAYIIDDRQGWVKLKIVGNVNEDPEILNMIH